MDISVNEKYYNSLREQAESQRLLQRGFWLMSRVYACSTIIELFFFFHKNLSLAISPSLLSSRNYYWYEFDVSWSQTCTTDLGHNSYFSRLWPLHELIFLNNLCRRIPRNESYASIMTLFYLPLVHFFFFFGRRESATLKRKEKKRLRKLQLLVSLSKPKSRIKLSAILKILDRLCTEGRALLMWLVFWVVNFSGGNILKLLTSTPFLQYRFNITSRRDAKIKFQYKRVWILIATYCLSSFLSFVKNKKKKKSNPHTL